MNYHSYIFFDSEPSIHTLTKAGQQKAKKAFAAALKQAKQVMTQAYATLALKSGTRFMLHINAETPEAIQELVRDLMHTDLGKHLRIAYTLMGMTHSSPYKPKNAPGESSPVAPHKYLVVYPFTKTIEWHLMPYEERRSIMKAHVDVGHNYSTAISQLLLYAYGIDDHEFIVSYQMDSLEEFQSLVMDMRATESRRHTKNDLPIFTCIHMSILDALEMV